jgi:hypothetical protein
MLSENFAAAKANTIGTKFEVYELKDSEKKF